ncbi:hypothetical protein CY0110_18552 [Crocosphaera chwakensis CCY0110]|uniref:Uncharacterized protein n=1 Tax=Crocosphaera chwakensis CCY0110 TaxID=391612 RepID=A3IJ42_9CHRO|nr:hypothetical protein CY0110_18552 [Crocosphaera chwakensis CCY0110]
MVKHLFGTKMLDIFRLIMKQEKRSRISI